MFLFLPVLAFAQSADLEVVSVVDSPDPVAPGATLSYSVTVRNNGPDAATNGGVNINLPASSTHTTDSVPAGWSCLWSGTNGTCSTPSFASGVTAVLTINSTVGAHLASFPDQTITATFFPAGSTADPNSGNNTKTSNTLVDSQQVDVSLTASDSPDPVFPDGNVTYTVSATNGGPDTASTVNLNVVPHSSLQFQSATVPAGWSCTLPAVNAINATFTCSRATWAPGTDNFGFVFRASDEQFGINDTTFSTNFNIGAGGSNETDHTDNSVTLSTTYTTPDADVSVAVTDSPDPVAPDGNITYSVTVANAGPNLAPNITLNSFGGNNLRFQSATVPAGWNCTLPPPGTQTTSLTCNLPGGMAVGGSSILTFVMEADSDILGVNDGTISFGFTASSTISDPVPGNNTENESTTYTTPDADVSVAVTDSPDPVAPDGNITYTVTVANAGPNMAPNITLNSFGGNNLRFQSATVPAGWNCTLPPPGTQTTSLTCNLPGGMAVGGSSILTFVMEADSDILGVNDGTISFGFTAGSTISDPVPGNNTETESTGYSTADADVSVTVSDSPDPVAPDGNITYTVTVANAGPDLAPTVTLSSFGANNLRFQSASVPAGWNCTLPAPGTQTTSLTCTLPGGLASGGSSVLTFVMQADDALLGVNDGTIQFGFTAGSSVSDPVPGNNTETESTAYVTPDADVSVTVSDSPDPVGPDGDITYTVTVANAGPDLAPNVTLSSFGANNLRFQSATVPAGWNCTLPAPGTQTTSLTCNLPGGMASGGSSIFTFVMQADDALLGNADGTIQFGFTATSTISDPVGTNNTETESTLYDVPNADLGVTATDAPDPVAAGSNITYTGTLTNAGADTATSVTFTIPLSTNLLFQSLVPPAGFSCATPPVGTNGTITCTIASLPSGATLPFSLVAQVNPVLNNGPDYFIEQGFHIGSSTNDPVGTNNSITVSTQYTTPDANLVVTNSDAPDPVATGGTITYTQTITNNGPDTAVNATFTQTTPIGTTFQSFTPAPGWTCGTPAVGATGAITCSKATMISGETGTFTLVVNVTGGGPIGSTVTGDSDTYDPDPSNNDATASTIVTTPTTADLSITKTTATATAPVGSTFTYTITATNNGPDAATSVVITDVLPAQLLFRSITTPAGFTCTTPAFRTNGTVTCNGATLANGASAAFNLVVEVAQGASGAIVNGVSITSGAGDPNGGNSSTTAPVVAPGPASAELTLAKTTTSTFATTGSNVTYTITVGNTGPSAATNVTVNDTLPAGLTFVSATPSQGTCNAVSPVVCNLGTILAGGNATVTLVAQVTATSGTVSNTATVTSPESTGPDSSTTPPLPVTSTAAPAGIPTLSEWMLMVLAGMLGVAALVKMRT